MTQQAKSTVPPYATYKSFTNLINDLKENGLPDHITPTVLKGSNSGKAMMKATLKSLGLTNSEGEPTSKFTQLIDSEEDYNIVLKGLVENTYHFLFDGSINLENTTTEKVVDKFKDVGAGGSTVSKCMSFFLAIAKDAGIEVSSRVKAPTPVRVSVPQSKPLKKTGDQLEQPPRSPSTPEEKKGFVTITVPLHGMPDGCMYFPKDMEPSEWAYTVKIAKFMLENYRPDVEQPQ